jgi:hypothetical protein
MRMLVLACFLVLFSQPVSSQSRAQEIATSFTKHKNVVKEKRGVRVEKYKDVQSEPFVTQNLQEYAGVYEVSDWGYELTIDVASDGRVRAYGPAFELQNAKIDDGVLTGTAVYRDGRTERFEGAFLTRTDRDSPSDPDTVTHGLGVILANPVERDGNTFDKLFFQKR